MRGEATTTTTRPAADDAPDAPPALDPSDLDALRVLLLRLITEGHGDEAVGLVLKLLSDLRDEDVSLQHRLRESLRRLHGRSSEKLTPMDAELLTRLLGHEETTPDTPPGDPAKPESKPASGDGPRPRKPLPEGAVRSSAGCPRRARPRTCPQCGRGLHPFGHVDSWQVEYVPGHFVLHTTEREQLSCRTCRDVVVTAPAPPKLIDAGEAGAGLLAKILVDKGENNSRSSASSVASSARD